MRRVVHARHGVGPRAAQRARGLHSAEQAKADARINVVQGSSTQQLFQRQQGSGLDLLFFFSC